MIAEFRRVMHPSRFLAIILLATISGYNLIDTVKAEEILSGDKQTRADPTYQAREYLNEGVKAFTDQKYDAAAQFFQKSIDLDPDSPDDSPRMYLATAYMLQFVPGSTDPQNEQMALKAIKTFNDIVQRSEKRGDPNVNAMLAVASLTYQMKDVAQTREWCNRILRLDAATDDMKKKKAEAHYRIAVVLFDDVHERTGVLGEKVANLAYEDKLQILSSIEEGLSHLEEAVKIRSDFYDAMMYQNLLWRELGKLADDEADKQEVIRRADSVYAQAVKLKLAAESEAAAKRKQIPSEK